MAGIQTYWPYTYELAYKGLSLLRYLRLRIVLYHKRFAIGYEVYFNDLIIYNAFLMFIPIPPPPTHTQFPLLPQ